MTLMIKSSPRLEVCFKKACQNTRVLNNEQRYTQNYLLPSNLFYCCSKFNCRPCYNRRKLPCRTREADEGEKHRSKALNSQKDISIRLIGWSCKQVTYQGNTAPNSSL